MRNIVTSVFVGLLQTVIEWFTADLFSGPLSFPGAQAFGQMLAFSQYALCAVLPILWFQPDYGVPDTFAAVVPVGFEGWV